ncbi:MAG: D-Ala-D-Ala carboxypeptidase family metallohydrolase [Bryobacteraceae bacterium]
MNMRDIYIVPHFQYRELECRHCGKQAMVAETMLKLEKLRELLGGHPIVITSGFRCDVHNAAVGGSMSSQHLFGRAVDIVCYKVDLHSDKAFHAMLESGFTGIGRGVKLGGGKTTHVDDGHARHTFWKYTPEGMLRDDDAYEQAAQYFDEG